MCKSEKGQEHGFSEIDINIEHETNLPDALTTFLSKEKLTGDNKVNCSTCNKKTEAYRCTKIVNAPTVLNLQLIRYTYDRDTSQKKKLASNFTFPNVFKLNGEVEYQLTSVLYHRGLSAHGGG